MASLQHGDIVLDFQSTSFEHDHAILRSLLLGYQKQYESLSSSSSSPPPLSSKQDQAGHNNETKQDGKQHAPLFDISPPKYIAGWYFSKLHIANELVSMLYQLHSKEIDSINIKKRAAKAPLGKYYLGEPFVAKFVIWLNGRLKDAGSKAQLKIGKEMADERYGLAQTIFGLALGKFIDGKTGSK